MFPATAAPVAADSIDALRAIGREFHGRSWALGTSSNYSVVLDREPLELLITASGKDKSALGRDVKTPTARRIAGLDVARFGDDSNAICIRRGQEVNYIEEWRNMDLMKTVSICLIEVSFSTLLRRNIKIIS
jgi:hypothetical protein